MTCERVKVRLDVIGDRRAAFRNSDSINFKGLLHALELFVLWDAFRFIRIFVGPKVFLQ